jgi:hypothetical protein
MASLEREPHGARLTVVLAGQVPAEQIERIQALIRAHVEAAKESR